VAGGRVLMIKLNTASLRLLQVIGVIVMMNIWSLNAKADFFNERYRGWYWFEEASKDKKIPKHAVDDNSYITPEQAKAEIDAFKAELDNLRYVMLARPTVENVVAYRAKEKEMWDKGMILHDAWDMANFKYPEQRDLINNPVNTFAVKLQREQEALDNQAIVEQFAKKFSLVFFFSGKCKYCQAFSPVLQGFQQKYGFKVEAVSMDGSKHEFFKTFQVPQLVQQLGISSAPTVIAVSDDGEVAFELIRGYVTITELEEYAALAVKYLQEVGKWR
jgi:conjugal transfer pilus assembly protein TraF